MLQAVATRNLVELSTALESLDQRTLMDRNTLVWGLSGACKIGEIEMIDLLLRHGADPNGRVSMEWGAGAYPPLTPAAAAVANGRAEPLALLVAHGAQIQSDKAVLPAAIRTGQIETVNFALKAGADPTGSVGVAVLQRVPGIVKAVLETGADANGWISRFGLHDVGGTVVCEAADLKRLGYEIEPFGESSLSVLHCAVKNRDLEIVRMLVRAGAKLDRPTLCNPSEVRTDFVDKLTPLALAAHSGDVAVTQCLLESGANPNAGAEFHRNQTADDFGRFTVEDITPLILATVKGHVEVVRTLIALGADPVRPWTGLLAPSVTPLMVAQIKGHASIATILRDAGANPSETVQDDGNLRRTLAFLERPNLFTY